MNPSCCQCGAWINADNRAHPGYCGHRCRDIALDAFNEARATRKRHRATMRARGHNAVEVTV